MENAASTLQNIDLLKKQHTLNPQDLGILAQLFNYFYERHDFAKAESYLKKIDTLDESNIEVKFLLGVTCQFQQRYPEAINWYLRAIHLYPKHIQACSNVGHVYMLLNDLENAEYYFHKAIEINPDSTETAHAYSNLGILAIDKDKLIDAVKHFKKAIQLQPNHYKFQINLAHAYLIKKLYNEAFEVINKIPENDETRIDRSLELAKIYDMTKQRSRAIQLLQEEKHNCANDPRIFFLLGELLYKDDKIAEAQSCFQQAIEIEPYNVQMISAMAHQSLENGDTIKAKEYLQKILELMPGHAETYANLAYICLLEGNPEGAVNCCEICLGLDPHNINALRFIGHAYQLKHEPEKAADYLLQALELKPDDVDIMAHLGSIHKGINATRLPRQLCYNSITSLIEQYHNRKSENDPIYFTAGQATALAQYAYNCRMNCLWEDFRKVEPILKIVVRDQLDANVALGISPFISQFTLDPQTQMLIHQGLAKRNKAAHHLIYQEHPTEIKGKMKIGYISPDFNGHVVGFLIQDYFELHDHDQFEIYAYSLRNIYDEVRTKIEKNADYFRDISDLPAPEAAKCIYEDGIHILIDLAGYTTGAKPAILGYQPAPIQAHFIGWAGSMAADYIQYHINTKDLVPEEQLSYYKEKIVYLPEAPIAVPFYEIPEIIPKHSDYHLPSDKFIFACFNNSYRIDESLFRAWMKILHAVPNSVLWLNYFVEETCVNLKNFAKECDVSPDRLIFRPIKKLNDDWHHRLADLYLDTTVVSGGTTTILSARAGLPVLCIHGETPQSRYGSGLMAACGMNELICNNIDTYTQKAIELAQNSKKMKEIRDRLTKKIKTSTLFNQARWIKQLEEAYKVMWNAHTKGLQDKILSVKK